MSDIKNQKGKKFSLQRSQKIQIFIFNPSNKANLATAMVMGASAIQAQFELCVGKFKLERNLMKLEHVQLKPNLIFHKIRVESSLLGLGWVSKLLGLV